jgi:lipopolysaccharide transport system permease protein
LTSETHTYEKPDDKRIVEPLIIEPSRGWNDLQLRELWQYRELLVILTWRDVRVRYKQTILGLAWAILNPLMTMVIFSLIFGSFAKIPSDGIPYPLFSYAALVPWTFFASATTDSSASLLRGIGLVKKIYFPRMVLPISQVLSSLADFVPAFLVLIVMILGFMASAVPSTADFLLESVSGITYVPQTSLQLTWNVLWLPVFLLLAGITALGTGLWLSALSAQFRDVNYVLPFVVRMWMWVTPVAYPSTIISGPIALLFNLNPLTHVINGFRWALLGTDTAPGPEMLISTSMVVVFLVSGAFFYRRMEKTFADVA